MKNSYKKEQKVLRWLRSSVVVGAMTLATFHSDVVNAELKHPRYGIGTLKVPKNIIFLISDGMGYNHVKATDYYEGNSQIYESFPVKTAMSTFSAAMGDPATNPQSGPGYDLEKAWKDFEYVKNRPTDSAPAATSMSTGVKTYNGSIGMDMNKQPLTHIAEVAQLKGKSTGVITTVQFSHATPAGFVAHNVNRNNYSDIAKEMLLDSKCRVIMGCGHPDYNDNGEVRTTKDYKYVGGQETWTGLKNGYVTIGGNQVEDIDGDGRPDSWSLIEDRADFQALAQKKLPKYLKRVKRLLGVPKAATTLQQVRGGDGKAAPEVVPFNQGVPTLVEMTKAAINVLDNDRNGFFLMIEGGAIDWASHANQSGRMIEEQMDFNRTVEAVVDWVEKNSNWNETMVIVTGDHECGYLWGPGSGVSTFAPIVDNGRGVVPSMAWYSGDHSNSLIPFFAKGPGTQLYQLFADEVDPVRGRFITNTEIAQAMFLLWDDSYFGSGSRSFGFECNDDEKILSENIENLKLLDFSLEQNYPNPFNPSTTINFTLKNAGRATLEVYNVLGQKVASIFDSMLEKGQHSYQWNAHSLSSGTYFYKLVSGNYSATKKLTLVK